MTVHRPRTDRRLSAGLRELPPMTVIDLAGDIDGFGEKALTDAYTQATGRAPSAILLNFAGVSYINSKGIALLISLLLRARASGHHLLASGLSPHYLEIFEITRLSEFFRIMPDEAAALVTAQEMQ